MKVARTYSRTAGPNVAGKLVRLGVFALLVGVSLRCGVDDGSVSKGPRPLTRPFR
jgi:hypothetical protein